MKNKKNKKIITNNIVINNIDNDEQYYNNSTYKLKVDKSYIENAGKGVFTLEQIPSKSFIGYYEGDMVEYINCGLYYFSINDCCGINAISFPRCYMAMLNDGRNRIYNNCEFIIDNNYLKVELWSIKDIKEGDELLVDYGSEYWTW